MVKSLVLFDITIHSICGYKVCATFAQGFYLFGCGIDCSLNVIKGGIHCYSRDTELYTDVKEGALSGSSASSTHASKPLFHGSKTALRCAQNGLAAQAGSNIRALAAWH